MADRTEVKLGVVLSAAIASMARGVRRLVKGKPRFDVESEWLDTTKVTVARFARGNISAQKGRILTRDEMNNERDFTVEVAEKWRRRHGQSASV